MQSHHHTPRWF
ncbi:hypothetical protein E2C01_094192 [Portunus trituberculatus]|uniref:Uncharacterized protein n=1 Tax=Portunus trituberculatus TaxID=210409 RepID=A0A5B7JVI1_PORTR|nr:hypothetical protein [Portunus trituberculatus]